MLSAKATLLVFFIGEPNEVTPLSLRRPIALSLVFIVTDRVAGFLLC